MEDKKGVAQQTHLSLARLSYSLNENHDITSRNKNQHPDNNKSAPLDKGQGLEPKADTVASVGASAGAAD